MKKIVIGGVVLFGGLLLVITYILISPLSVLQLLTDDESITKFREDNGDAAEEYGYYNDIDIEIIPGSIPVVYYNQTEEPYASHSYGRRTTIKSSGCGPTAMAMVASTITGQTITPIEMADWSLANGYRVYNAGTSRGLFPAAAANWGFECQGLEKSAKKVVNALSNGRLVIAIMGKGHFTNNGHYIVLRGISEDGLIMVADPASRTRSEQLWDLSIIMNECKTVDSATKGPFWSFWKEEETTKEVTTR